MCVPIFRWNYEVGNDDDDDDDVIDDGDDDDTNDDDDDDEVDIFSVRRPFPISAGMDICLGGHPPPQLDIDDQLHHNMS